MTDLTIERTEDFLQKVLDAIENNDLDGATKLILELQNDSDVLTALRQINQDTIKNLDLARDRVRDLDLARDRDLARAHTRARVRDLALDHTRALARARAVAFDLILARDLARAHALDLDLAHALDLNRVRAHALDRDLTRALDRDRDLALDRALALALDKVIVANSVIVQVLRQKFGAPTNPTSEAISISRATSGAMISRYENRVSLTFMGIDTLTPKVLGNHIVPYLQSLVDLQRIIDEMQGNKLVESRIVSITQNSPVEAVIENVSKAIVSLWEDIIPWRRKHAKSRADLELAEKSQTIAQLNVELAATRAHTEQENKKTEIEVEKAKVDMESARADLELKRIAIDKARLELTQSKIQLGLHIINQVAPSLPETQKLAYLTDIVKQIDVIERSPLEIKDRNTPDQQT